MATMNPVLASEWHPTKNNNLSPQNVTVGSEKMSGGNATMDMNGSPQSKIVRTEMDVHTMLDNCRFWVKPI